MCVSFSKTHLSFFLSMCMTTSVPSEDTECTIFGAYLKILRNSEVLLRTLT